MRELTSDTDDGEAIAWLCIYRVLLAMELIARAFPALMDLTMETPVSGDAWRMFVALWTPRP